MEENNNEITEFETSGKVALPFNEEQFKDFIVSLLGKPQTISKFINGSFEINKNNLITLFELINQRIYQQNDSKLIQFRATIYYNDNTTITLNGFDHLVHYNENLPVVSRAVHLTWQYLVKFRDKKTFEKQEISLSFVADDEGPMPIFEGHSNNRYYDSGINFIISHTARTWGADIEALLTKHLEVLVKKDSKILRYIRYSSDSVNNIIFSILFLITLIFSYRNTLNQLQNKETASDSVFWIHHYGNYVFLLIGIYIIYKITTTILEEFQYFKKPSFVILTPESEKYKTKLINNYRNNLIKYFITAFTSIILGVLGNYIYENITK
jgi:hypothetical protein